MWGVFHLLRRAIADKIALPRLAVGVYRARVEEDVRILTGLRDIDQRLVVYVQREGANFLGREGLA